MHVETCTIITITPRIFMRPYFPYAACLQILFGIFFALISGENAAFLLLSRKCLIPIAPHKRCIFLVKSRGLTHSLTHSLYLLTYSLHSILPSNPRGPLPTQPSLGIESISGRTHEVALTKPPQHGTTPSCPRPPPLSNQVVKSSTILSTGYEPGFCAIVTRWRLPHVHTDLTCCNAKSFARQTIQLTSVETMKSRRENPARQTR